MASWYVAPPEDKYTGVFIVSVDGVGYSRYSHHKEYKLVSVLCNRDQEGNPVYTFYFEQGKKVYECSPSFPLINGKPAAKVGNRWVVCPKPLYPFSEPTTRVRQM